MYMKQYQRSAHIYSIYIVNGEQKQIWFLTAATESLKDPSEALPMLPECSDELLLCCYGNG